MPNTSFVISPESDFSFGIDARSAENQIDPGFAKDLLNVDIIEKRPRKRPGLQGYAGNLPVRVSSLQYIDSTNQVCLTLDSSISLSDTVVDLSGIRSTPIVVYGRSSSISSGGPFTTAGDTAHYYSAISIPTRKVLTGDGASHTLTITSDEHGIATTNLFAGLVESTSSGNSSNSQVLPTISVDESSKDLSVTYQNNTGADIDAFVFYKDQTAEAGRTYIGTFSHGGTGSETLSISAGTHSLSNFNILCQVQKDNGTTRELSTPDSVVIHSNGGVDVTITSGTAGTYYVILEAAPVTNTELGSVAASSTGTILISDLTSPWIFYGVYLETTPGGDKELVIPDSISYDDTTQEATLSFTNASPSARSVYVYYDYGVIRSNQLCVTDSSVTTNATDTAPQLTVWGLDHSEIYGAQKSGRSGWTTHIDSYRAAGEHRLVSGLGGNLFAAEDYETAASTYDYALLYPDLLLRTAGNRTLGPLFWETGDTPARTRGYVTADLSATNWAVVTAAAYDSGTGYTKYTISLPNKQILDSTGTPTTLSAVISTTSELEDWLTLRNMPFVRHNGTFRIRQITDGTDSIDIYVENDSVSSSDWDDTGCQGDGGIFTDHMVWLTDSTLIPGDTVKCSAFGDTLICTTLSSSGTSTVIDGVVDLVSVPGGVLTPSARTSSVIPMRSAQPSATPSVTNLVRGDMLASSTLDRLLRVLAINPNSDLTVDITVDTAAEEATITLGSGDTSAFRVGGKILLLQAGAYTGVQTITAITSTTEMTFDSTESAGFSGATLAGKTVELDEEIEWEDSTDDSSYYYTAARWISIEAPDDSFNLTPTTHTRYFDSSSYGDQAFLRSSMVGDNLYLENSEDEAYKYDGVNNYRAGLFPWQPGLFLIQNIGASTKLQIDVRSISYNPKDAALGRLTISAGDAGVIPVGSTVLIQGDTKSYTIREYTDDGTSYYVLVDRALSSSVASTGTISEIATFRYYFRLNAVDANNNIVASAVTGYQDHVVQLGASAAVQIRGVGFPAWDVYDYDRIDVQVYRTKQSLSAPFYKLPGVAQVGFDNGKGYFLYTDVFSDDALIDLDPVNTALKGSELGVGWQEPLRSKYVTSIGNSLVLANITDYPQLDIQLSGDGTVVNSTLNGKKFLFRRDSSDTGTTTDMVSRVTFQFVSGTTDDAGTFDFSTANKFKFVATNLPAATAPGDWIYLTYDQVYTTGKNLVLSGWWQIADLAGTTVTINYPGVADPGTYPNKYVVATDPTDVPVLLGLDGNLGMVNGNSFLLLNNSALFDSMRRMSMAINAVMRMTDTTITGMSTFVPWLTATGGNDSGKAGRLVVRQPRADSTTLELVLPSSISGFDVFVNDIRRAASAEISAITRVYPSRVLASYENYPEIFDSPTAVLATDSDSAIDVNPADGQDITAIIPFFGEATFGAAQQSTVLVCFKQNSIYLVDLNEKRNGRNPIQRIETEGLGCTAPYSVSSSKKGIMFANESGMYCLRRDLSIQYLGKYMERNWDRVEKTELSIAQGHHYGVGRSYKLSVPITDSGSENSEVFVYNHTGEDEGKQGAWTRYDNHPSTGWANLGQDAYMATTGGRVLSVRRLQSDEERDTNYRDDDSAITTRMRTRDLDFGNAGIRKILDRIITKYRTDVRNTGTVLRLSTDTSEEYRDTTPIIIPHNRTTSGIDDVPNQAIYTIVHTTDRRRGVYFSIEIENSGIDEPLDISGIDCRIDGLSTQGITSAQQTGSK
jgi:hypothetical protein